jgi:hypothetical protein
MAHPAEDRAALKAHVQEEEEPTSENELSQDSQDDTPIELPTGNRRETITKKTVKKLRI